MKTIISDDIRACMAADKTLGAGNFLRFALAHSPAPEEPILFLEKPLRTFFGEEFLKLTYQDLDRLSDIYAALYRQYKVKAYDPVFIYLDDGIEYLIHYLALTKIGAIGVLTNGNMATETALGHARNTGSVGIFTDASHLKNLESLIKHGEFSFVLTEERIQATLAELPLAPAFEHAEDDPIMIAHSSGTTGIPKAVLLQNDRFIYGVRYRLALPRVPGGETILSSLPHSHNCAIAYIMLALLSGTPVYITSDHSGASVLKSIEEFKPKMMVSFPQTYVEMTEQDLNAFDLSSVKLWFNGGDAAHESHIRALLERVPGSIFIDGMGSSEMGFSLFRNVHTKDTNNYNRCVGKPLEWVDAQILSEDGRKLEPMQIGRLGVKAPSVTTGYWNNSLLTYRSRLSGYFLTGDLAYRDAENRFFHVDRVPDAIQTEAGPVYGLQLEEHLLSRFGKEIADCSVLGVKNQPEGSTVPVAFVRPRPESSAAVDADKLLQQFNRSLVESALPQLFAVRFSAQADIPLGTTGKVLKRVLRNTERIAP